VVRSISVRRSLRNFRPRYLNASVELSLRRLGTDYLDLFYLHNPPPEIVSDGGMWAALEALKQRGLIRYYGVSCGNSASSAEALAWLGRPGISALQVPVHALDSIDLETIRPRAREAGAAIVGRQPFRRGAIFSDPGLRGVLTQHSQRTPAQTALRLALQRPGVDLVLVGMTSRAHLEENLGALEAPALSPVEVADLNAWVTHR
jgi:aryl-alcohol dehydrogenase-like predicted oxidoreductase